jgi:triosephosphate isomerase
MAKKMIVGNWKMNLAPDAAVKFAKRLESKLVDEQLDSTVVVCPASVSLFAVKKTFNTKRLSIGAQNISPMDEGAYTGEISAPMVHGLAKYVLVGHSERRAMGEHDKLIAQKVAAALRSDLIPILCVGETLNDRHHNLSTKVVVDQLSADLRDLIAAEVAKVVIAYEPVWAIGTGEFATPDQVEPMVRAIRKCVEDLYGEAGGAGIQVLYGGSVKSDNAASYLKIDGVDGLLVGGASLIEPEFIKIVAIADKISK